MKKSVQNWLDFQELVPSSKQYEIEVCHLTLHRSNLDNKSKKRNKIYYPYKVAMFQANAKSFLIKVPELRNPKKDN